MSLCHNIAVTFLVIIFLGYGLTEICGITHMMPPDSKAVPGSLGVLLSNLESKVIGTIENCVVFYI